MEPNERIWWWEPYGSTVRRSWAAFSEPAMLRPWFWVRVYAACLVFLVAFLLIATSSFPGMLIPWRQILIAMVIAPPLILGLCILNAVLPPCVIEVRSGGISIAHGQRGPHLTPADIDTAALFDAPDGSLRLRLAYRTRRGTPRVAEYAVSRKVDPDALRALLAGLTRPNAQTTA